MDAAVVLPLNQYRQPRTRPGAYSIYARIRAPQTPCDASWSAASAIVTQDLLGRPHRNLRMHSSNLGEVTSVLPVSVGDLARSVSPARIRAGTGTDHEPDPSADAIGVAVRFQSHLARSASVRVWAGGRWKPLGVIAAASGGWVLAEVSKSMNMRQK
jgi:hypothetical protein